MEIPRGGICSKKPKCFKESMELNWNFQKGVVIKPKFLPWETNADIFQTSDSRKYVCFHKLGGGGVWIFSGKTKIVGLLKV